MGDIETPPLCLSVCPSHFVFALYLEDVLMYFLKLCRYVHHDMGVCCIVFDIDGMLFEFLAPPAERQRSFSNTDLSVVRLSVRPSVCPSVCLSVRPSRLRGGGVYLRNASVTFLIFWHEASFG